jgi:hypothetical protein
MANHLCSPPCRDRHRALMRADQPRHAKSPVDRVVAGPFAQFLRVLQRLGEKGRVQVLLNIMGRQSYGSDPSDSGLIVPFASQAGVFVGEATKHTNDPKESISSRTDTRARELSGARRWSVRRAGRPSWLRSIFGPQFWFLLQAFLLRLLGVELSARCSRAGS